MMAANRLCNPGISLRLRALLPFLILLTAAFGLCSPARAQVTAIYSFTGGNDGDGPSFPPIQASDGNLYGIADGGANGYGVLYRCTLGGSLTPLVEFPGSGASIGSSGPLTQASNGYLYGTVGTIFRVTVAAVPADFNGDGRSDLLLMNPSTGQMAVWYMDGLQATGGAFLSQAQVAGWVATRVGDFNGDGHPDVLFQNQSTGQLAIWFMNGVSITGAGYLSAQPPSGWWVVAPH